MCALAIVRMCGSSVCHVHVKMALDVKGNRRGRCLVCIECREFTAWAKNIRCAYCDCPPTKHELCPILAGGTRGTDSQTFAANENVSHQHTESKLATFEESADHHFQQTSLDDHDLPSFTRDGLHSGMATTTDHRTEIISTNVKEEEGFSKKPAPEKILTCPICKKKFKKVLNLKSHILLHKGKQKFKCNICKCIFKGFEQLVKHKQLHQKELNKDLATSSGRVEQNRNDPTNKQVKRRKTTTKVTAIAPKQQTTLPTYQQGLNLWGASNQGAFLMSPLTNSLFPQVSMPTAQLMQTNTFNQMGKGVQPIYQQQPQQMSPADNQNSISQKMLNLMQIVDAKMNALSQIDRKLDFIIHSFSMPRQQTLETPNFTIETDQVARSFEQMAAQIDDPGQATRLLTTSEPLAERVNYKRGSISPGDPIPDSVLEEAYKASVSRRNLAKNLVFMVFTPEELRGRNCSGRVYGKGLPKERLDQRKLHSVKIATFKKYPCDPTELDLIWQRECIKAIDKAIRSRALSNKL